MKSKCENCKYKKYKRKYEIAKSGLSDEEREMLIELICNEQTIHMIAKQKYESDRYNKLEQLKAKIRIL